MMRRVTASHQTVRLARGRHPSPQLGACVMELASMLADEPFTDRPGSTSPVIAALLRTYNDGVGDDRRQDLYPLASLIVGTASSRRVEQDRASRCLEFAGTLGLRLPSGRAAIGVATAEGSGSWAALAALRSGPTAEVHELTLSLARELAAMRSRRQRRWPDWASALDPARAVEDALAEGHRSLANEQLEPMIPRAACAADPDPSDTDRLQLT